MTSELRPGDVVDVRLVVTGVDAGFVCLGGAAWQPISACRKVEPEPTPKPEPRCECNADDWNERSEGYGGPRVPHALNCPARGESPAPTTKPEPKCWRCGLNDGGLRSCVPERRVATSDRRKGDGGDPRKVALDALESKEVCRLAHSGTEVTRRMLRDELRNSRGHRDGRYTVRRACDRKEKA